MAEVFCFLKKGHFLVYETNPYECPPVGPTQDPPLQTPTALTSKRVFLYSYCTSLVVALAVVVIWVSIVLNDTSVPDSQRRTTPPDIVELVFLFITTLPSVPTCLIFSLWYCWVIRIPAKRRTWPALLVGAISGAIFNALTAIRTIEYFFDW